MVPKDNANLQIPFVFLQVGSNPAVVILQAPDFGTTTQKCVDRDYARSPAQHGQSSDCVGGAAQCTFAPPIDTSS